MFPTSSIFGRGPLLALLAFAFVLPAQAQATTSRDVKRAINGLSGGAGAYAWNVTDRRAVAGRNQTRARIIASNAKLFTSAAALARFGTGGRFSTAVHTNGTVTAGTLTGDLYLRGGGDPLFGNSSFVTTNFGSRATIETLADNLKAQGITRVSGGVIGDESAFDSRRGTAYSGWGRSGDIGGTLGGLIVNKGFVAGRYQASPPLFAAQRLAAALQASGIKVTTPSTAGRTPAGARRLTFVRSLPVSALVRQMNKPSNNYLAEMLVKSLALSPGAADDDDDGGSVAIGSTPATTRAGYTAAVQYAASLGSRLKLLDGSGLSRSDRAAPREVVDLLRGIQKTVAFTDFRASLPIAGVDGTLHSRMTRSIAKNRCQAKTGTLSNVSTLSGYCTTIGGDLVAFSLLQNSVAPYSAKLQQDRVAGVIAGLN